MFLLEHTAFLCAYDHLFTLLRAVQEVRDDFIAGLEIERQN